MEIILISWTCGTKEEAWEVAHFLAEENLIACAHITSIESIFRWGGKIEACPEVQVTFKTRESLFESVKEALVKKSKYEVPEILKIPIKGGYAPYIDWVLKSTG